VSTNAAQLHKPVSRRVVAIFDLDGTLTTRDTLFPFLRFYVGTLVFSLKLPIVLVVLAAMAIRLVSRARAKEMVLGLYAHGALRENLQSRGEAFARERMTGLVRRAGLERLAWHQRRGHRCVLATASASIYVEPWARQAGFDDVSCTQLEYDTSGRFTGRFSGGNCQGEEKLRRLQALIGSFQALTTYGYGDSPGDRHFLSECTESHYRPFRAQLAQAPAAKPQNRVKDLVRLLRPHQWVKNGFVFVGLLFGHAWAVPEYVRGALFAAAAFCLVASAIYIINDCCDMERDRMHPKKRHRPLASGKVAPRVAIALCAVLAIAGLGLALAAGPMVLLLVSGYALINLAYSYGLKSVVILDVFIIAAGFILRILAGTLGIGIAPSQWLLVCSLFLTLFLGFTKRRSELLSVGEDFLIHRKVLMHYNAALLDKIISVCAAASLLSYSLYTMSPTTVRIHGTESLIYTIPFVAYGIFRYLHLLHAKHAGADTSSDLVRDPHLVGALAGWALATAYLIR